MTLDDRARADLLGTFRQELAEHCQTLNRAFLSLEKEPAAAEQRRLLDEAFRAAHSLKGAARAVAARPVESLAHGLEEVLAAARRDERPLTPALFDLLYAVIDCLAGSNPGDVAALVAEAPAGPATMQHPDAAALRRQLAAAAALLAGTQPPAAGSPAETPPATAQVTPPDEPGAVPQVPPTSASGETVRLPAARLDAVLDQLGELVVTRLEIEETLAALLAVRRQVDGWQREWRRARQTLSQRERAELGSLGRFLEVNETNLTSLSAALGALENDLASVTSRFGLLTQELQTEVRRLRMLPFDTLAGLLERAVRDLARSLGKEARLIIVGAETELDRRILEEIKDPLLHLLRNALDHGIEPPEERRRLGKPGTGSVVVTAAQRGGAVVVEVEDDGAGIDAGMIRRVAAERGLVPAAELAAMDDDAVRRLIFLPGYTTRQEVSELSGRGVGLDIVARNVERLGGRVEAHSTPGRGSLFVLTLPLTLTTTRAILVEAAGVRYALPASAVERVMRPERLGSVGGRPTLHLDGATLPVAGLSQLIDGRPPVAPLHAPVALLAAGARRLALQVDRVVGEQVIVVKPLGYPLLRIHAVAGATILGSGEVVPILNAADLVRAAAVPAANRSLPGPPPPAPHRQRVLIADDSLTTRTLERYILEAAGYAVELAADGVEAFALLQEGEYDVLVTDIDMPRLDGIALTARLRQDARFRELPIVLVTSLESAEDRERGLQAGADAYIVKSAFDQDHLLRTLQEIV